MIKLKKQRSGNGTLVQATDPRLESLTLQTIDDVDEWVDSYTRERLAYPVSLGKPNLFVFYDDAAARRIDGPPYNRWGLHGALHI